MNVDQRINQYLAKKKNGNSVTIEDGAEPALVRRDGGRTNVTVPSSLSREQEQAQRDEARRPKAVSFIQMPETSTEPTPATTVMLGDVMLFLSHDGGFRSRDAVVAITAEGERIEDAPSVLQLVYDKLRDGACEPTIAKANKKG